MVKVVELGFPFLRWASASALVYARKAPPDVRDGVVVELIVEGYLDAGRSLVPTRGPYTIIEAPLHLIISPLIQSFLHHPPRC